ncbi:adhesion G-protein coupled receptor V1-like [Onychostruthus taczanowskii]|uniref:adhesion G-protein coupled receptor V1-like n=1 Tax=Onychostruthus taczanowskii TaxID=356909 RepID=UPI001B803E4C|nr:adhesion G-protein coupled receptor V1-like [Onychostruthus taczanowskii]
MSEVSSPEGAWTYWDKSTKMIKGMEHLSYEEKLGELELLSLALGWVPDPGQTQQLSAGAAAGVGRAARISGARILAARILAARPELSSNTPGLMASPPLPSGCGQTLTAAESWLSHPGPGCSGGPADPSSAWAGGEAGLSSGKMCFIPNAYAALFTAALVPLMCLVVVFVVFIHAYQVTPQWKAYDDIFRGRTNAAEIPLVLYLFALISITWLWGGLHMAYQHLWMLVFFIIFNSLQGLYVFVVYFILHNQLCCPVKASYTVDMNGHTTPGSAFFTHGSGLPAVGGEISKSTQNLISAMEEVPADWERASLQPASQAGAAFKQSPQNGNVFHPSGGFSTSSLVADEESQEFDDLIFALKTGAGLSVSDNESCHGSQDGGSMANSQIVELRRIPIADTHL